MLNIKLLDKFIQTFNINNPTIFMDGFISVLSNRYVLNIIKFDDWLHAQGYKEEIHGSMCDYIRLKYGENGIKIVEQLI